MFEGLLLSVFHEFAICPKDGWNPRIHRIPDPIWRHYNTRPSRRAVPLRRGHHASRTHHGAPSSRAIDLRSINRCKCGERILQTGGSRSYLPVVYRKASIRRLVASSILSPPAPTSLSPLLLVALRWARQFRFRSGRLKKKHDTHAAHTGDARQTGRTRQTAKPASAAGSTGGLQGRLRGSPTHSRHVAHENKGTRTRTSVRHVVYRCRAYAGTQAQHTHTPHCLDDSRTNVEFNFISTAGSAVLLADSAYPRARFTRKLLGHAQRREILRRRRRKSRRCGRRRRRSNEAASIPLALALPTPG